MNWYKIAQEFAPISTSYDKDNQFLDVSFNGGKLYRYEDINIDNYNYIKSLLSHKNYEKAEETLTSWSNRRRETEEDRQEMLNELYDREILT